MNRSDYMDIICYDILKGYSNSMESHNFVTVKRDFLKGSGYRYGPVSLGYNSRGTVPYL